jgi:membrane protein YdbS with pleckstrin-like domain
MNASAKHEHKHRSFARTVLAGLVLLIAAWVLLKVVLGVVVWLATVAAVIVAIVAIVWALRVLL